MSLNLSRPIFLIDGSHRRVEKRKVERPKEVDPNRAGRICKPNPKRVPLLKRLETKDPRTKKKKRKSGRKYDTCRRPDDCKGPDRSMGGSGPVPICDPVKVKKTCRSLPVSIVVHGN